MERRLAAILAADVVEYSRLMGSDEAGTLATLKKLRAEIIERKVAEHHGRIVKLTGDGILAEFPSVVGAVACAVEMQHKITDQDVPPERRLEFRVGINLGDVIVEGEDIYGDGVNVAARLESIAPPGGVVVSGSVRDHVGNRLDLVFEDCGEQQLKNIEKPIRVYNVIMEEPVSDSRASVRENRPSIAVLPFTNMSGDPEQEYFSDGITEDIITDLSKVSGLRVIARHSAFSYKGKALKVQQIGRELGVAFVVEGSVRKAGTRVRVTGQLVDCRDGNHLWGERFDRDLTDIFAIQDEITHAIVAQLKVKLLPQERQAISQPPTANFEAYTYYLRGREFWHRQTKHYFQLARRMFAKAAELDPYYARAYAGIADCDSFLVLYYNARIGLESILAIIDKALALDERLAEAHASRGLVLSLSQHFDEAVREFQRAIALDGNSFEAHYFYGRACFAEGKIQEALDLFERAAEIRPRDLTIQTHLTHVYRKLGRDRERIEAARKTIEIAERELSLHPDDARPAQMGIEGLIELGETQRAREWISRALALEPDDFTVQYNVACGYTKLGDLDQAFDLLERWLPGATPEMKKWMKHDSDLDGLRNHPRYQKFLQLIG
jgi:Predicted integral membrane protein